jgi:ParB/RepB/Spo0J family partition protein
MENLKPIQISLDPKIIDFDTNNPRRESEEFILNSDRFKKLKESISLYGILEPIIVKESSQVKGRYVLIDGERRLRAAKNLQLEMIPALLIGSGLDGRVIAYQVHMLREQWNNAAQTKSIKSIIKEIRDKNPDISEKELIVKLKDSTKITPSRINDLLILTKYEDRYIDLVEEKKIDISYLVQGQKSFISRVANKFPEILVDYSEDQLRNIIAEKSIKNLVPKSRFWMDIFKDVFNHESDYEEIKQILLEFIENENVSAEDTLEKFNQIVKKEPSDIDYSVKEININSKSAVSSDPNTSSNNSKIFFSINPSSNSKEKSNKNSNQRSSNKFAQIKLTNKQQTSIKQIRQKYEGIGSTFTKNEYEYINEAIACLENNCFKASILMIWAAGISRILDFISKDIIDFNNCSLTMKTQNATFYKHHCQNFQINSTSIEAIRLASNVLAP